MKSQCTKYAKIIQVGSYAGGMEHPLSQSVYSFVGELNTGVVSFCMHESGVAKTVFVCVSEVVPFCD